MVKYNWKLYLIFKDIFDTALTSILFYKHNTLQYRNRVNPLSRIGLPRVVAKPNLKVADPLVGALSKFSSSRLSPPLTPPIDTYSGAPDTGTDKNVNTLLKPICIWGE